MPISLTPTSGSYRQLRPFRLNLLRAGYAFMGLGLAVTKWPQLIDAHELPLYEGVTLCLLTAMSLLALAGLYRPLELLPVLVFETLWKVLWLGLVALPQTATGGMDDATAEVAFRNAFVVVIIAVVPWDHVWRAYVGRAKTAAEVPTGVEAR